MSALNWGELVADAGASSNSYEILPDGDYDVKVVEASHTLTAKGKTMFKVKHQVQQGPYANRFLWDNIVISPENQTALGIFFRQMKALGLDQEYFQRNPSNDQIVNSINGVSVRVKVGHRPYQGEDRNEIKQYNAISGGGGGAFPGQPSNQPPVPQGQGQPQQPQAPYQQPQQQAPQYQQPQPPQQPQAPQSPWDNAPQQGGNGSAPVTPF